MAARARAAYTLSCTAHLCHPDLPNRTAQHPAKQCPPGRSKRAAPACNAASPLQYRAPGAVLAAVRAPRVTPPALPAQLTASRPFANIYESRYLCAQRPQRTPGWACAAPACAAASTWDKSSRGPAGSSALCCSQAVASGATRSGREDGKLRQSRPRLCGLSLGSHRRRWSRCPRRPGGAYPSQRALAERARRQRHPTCWLPGRPAERQRLEWSLSSAEGVQLQRNGLYDPARQSCARQSHPWLTASARRGAGVQGLSSTAVSCPAGNRYCPAACSPAQIHSRTSAADQVRREGWSSGLGKQH